MNIERLKQYRGLVKEVPMLEKKLEKLYDQKENIPEVMGKVQKSSAEFPYTLGHVPVEMDEPNEATRIKKAIRLNEERLETAKAEKLEIECFVKSITNSVDRYIMEEVFLNGKKHWEVADELGYTRSRISQKISEILQD